MAAFAEDGGNLLCWALQFDHGAGRISEIFGEHCVGILISCFCIEASCSLRASSMLRWPSLVPSASFNRHRFSLRRCDTSSSLISAAEHYPDRDHSLLLLVYNGSVGYEAFEAARDAADGMRRHATACMGEGVRLSRSTEQVLRVLIGLEGVSHIVEFVES